MQLASSQNIHTSIPLDTSPSRRVNDVSRTTSSSDTEDEKQQQEIERQEQQVVRELKSRDREVRAHEAAHMAAGGSLVRGGPSYTYQRGPDGRSYAVGGEVKLDVSKVPNDPEATLQKAEQIRSAALAPAQPSPQDLRVAANANQLAARARIEIAVQRREEAIMQAEQRQSDNSSRSATASPEVSTISSSSSSAQLASNEPPAAAMNAFMATAETEARPVLINQDV